MTQFPFYLPLQFEAQEDRELRMIFDGQNEMHNTLKELNRKLDELMGRQEMVLSRVSQLTGGNVQVAQVRKSKTVVQVKYTTDM